MKQKRYSNLFSCKGKVAIITGGCGLIGREITRALSEFGALVYIADINKEKAVEIVRSFKINFIYLDISSDNSIKEMVGEVVRNEGRVDILVNSAYPRTTDWGLKFEKVSFGSWKRNVDSHLGGYFICCQKVAEEMKRQGGGSIINLASTYGVVAPDFSIYEGTEMTMPVAYSAIKSGIISFTKYIATYYGRYNIRANTVSPGGVWDNQNPLFVERYSKRTPLGRMARPDEIVGAVVFLASDASSYITGQNILVDGGWTTW